MIPSLTHLPEEILHAILCSLPPGSSAALEQTCRRFKNVTNEPLLWRHYCQSRYRYWDRKHEIARKLSSPASSTDWKGLFVLRHCIDCSVTRLLDSILGSQTGRIEKFRAVIDYGYDAKDTLLGHSRVETGEDHFARRYYARALLTCLHRSIAVPEWARLARGEPVPLERALGAFDLFIPESGFGDLEEIKDSLAGLVTRFTRSSPDFGTLSPRNKALQLASWLRESDLIGIQQGREFHALEHNFIGLALQSSGHNSLPLISAAIYCYVAQALTLNAQPCGFPFHVHVIIFPPPGLDMNGHTVNGMGSGTPMYLDPFRGARETPVSDLRDQLAFLGASETEQTEFLGESLTSEIVLRCSRNIWNSIHSPSHQYDGPITSVDMVSAKYASVWSSMLLSGDSRPMDLRHQLPLLMELFATDFPSDIFLVEQYIVPLFQGLFEHEHILESLHVMRAVDEIPRQVRRRSGENKDIRYRVGQVFRHRRYQYQAIITGWDSECGAGEQWMRRMGIDRLQAGRHQSFYHVLVEDRSVRYVAEENIELFLPHLSEVPQSLIAIAGKHFKRWDHSSRAFVSNVRDEYPDD
ncbi:hypothetical protein N7462_001489 [Penicillium macrosclerotiorum]|uniref:uncharacterized protein n=1 Tax=Penicillium macrosclerotiorum TaxID=303699 RepID=UPI002547C994|nr:uncharacterized protein N7462_001489 [Penicillium macrosclerotiorum]KAJ5692066.1 hypothetical protein N7462_001489 [Penicillium macrosclerotiorum]